MSAASKVKKLKRAAPAMLRDLQLLLRDRQQQALADVLQLLDHPDDGFALAGHAANDAMMNAIYLSIAVTGVPVGARAMDATKAALLNQQQAILATIPDCTLEEWLAAGFKDPKRKAKPWRRRDRCGS